MKFQGRQKSVFLEETKQLDIRDTTSNDAGCDSDSESFETPVICFQDLEHQEEEDKYEEAEATPVVSASQEMYGMNVQDNFIQNVKLGIIKEVNYDDFLNTPHEGNHFPQKREQAKP